MKINKKTIVLNILSVFVALAVLVFNNIIISPYLVRTLGVESQGFIQLSNNITTLISIIAQVINAFGGRFIIDALAKNDHCKANEFYKAIFYGNIIILIILFFPECLFLVMLNKLINIPPELLFDVRLLFVCTFIYIFITYSTSFWSSAAYVKNKSYITFFAQMIGNIISVVFIIIQYSYFNPHIYYQGVALVISSVIVAVWSYFWKSVLMPEIRLKTSRFSLESLLRLVSSGSWSVFSKMSDFLLTGFDLIICNILLGSTAMGILGLSRAIPNLLIVLSNNIASSFCPTMSRSYSSGDIPRVLYELRKFSKLLSIIVSIPIVGSIVYGIEFFSLWQPTQEPDLLFRLAVLGSFALTITVGSTVLNNIFIIVNKPRPNAIISFIVGIINISVVITLVVFTDFDLYVIAGVSSILILVKNIIYVAPKTAKLLNQRWYTFMYTFGHSIICSLIVTIICLTVRFVIQPHNWSSFGFAAVTSAFFSILANSFVLFNKREKKSIFRLIKIWTSNKS